MYMYMYMVIWKWSYSYLHVCTCTCIWLYGSVLIVTYIYMYMYMVIWKCLVIKVTFQTCLLWFDIPACNFAAIELNE